MENIQKRKGFWGRFASKAGYVDTYSIARDMNIPEEKVKEILKGERELPSDKVDEFINVVNKTKKAKKNFDRNEALIFFNNNDPKELRTKFNYDTQKEVAELLGISQFTISRLEDPKYGPSSLSTRILCKLYDFYKDELNIKIIKGDNMKKHKHQIEDKDLELYKSTITRDNIKDLVKEKYETVQKFSKIVGINPSTIDKFARGQINWSDKMYQKVYNGLFNSTQKFIKVEKSEEMFTSEEKEEVIEKPIMSREEKYCTEKDNRYSEFNNECTTDMTVKAGFTPEVLFNYLIDNCYTKNVVELYKLLDSYFKN